MRWQLVLLLTTQTRVSAEYDWTSLNLPDSHIPYYFTSHPEIAEQCISDKDCPYKVMLVGLFFHSEFSE